MPVKQNQSQRYVSQEFSKPASRTFILISVLVAVVLVAAVFLLINSKLLSFQSTGQALSIITKGSSRPTTEVCIGNKCVLKPCSVKDADCPANFFCENKVCVPLPEKPSQPQSQSGEIFVGPLAGWVNAKTDYGAVGDGKTDDTAALQAALGGLRDGTHNTLYLPSGIYRITSTLDFSKNLQTGRPIDVKIVGEDPATTKIIWDGPVNGSMILYNANYASLGRLTFDGQKKAGKIIENGAQFSTWNRYFDLVLQDAGICFEAGKISDGYGITDSIILRSTFQRCSIAGILISNYNSLQWEIHNSLFKDNFVAVTNGNYHPSGQSELLRGAGNFHIHQSVFMNSTLADTFIGSALFFSIYDSISINSNAFHLSTPLQSPAQVTLQRNQIIDPRGDFTTEAAVGECRTMSYTSIAPICIGNLGPLILLDNIIRVREGYTGPIIKKHGPTASFISIGNTYTVNNWFEQTTYHNFPPSKLRSINDLVVNISAVKLPKLALPRIPPKINPLIFEIPPGSDTAFIQKAIDKAAQASGQRPVVHLQKGIYLINKTLVIPPNSDLLLIGEGSLYNTILSWIGKDSGPVLRIEGPSKAKVSELGIMGKDLTSGKGRETADGIVVVSNEGRIRTNQALASHDNEIGLFIDNLHRAEIEFISSGLGGRTGLKINNSQGFFATGQGGLGYELTYDIENSEVLLRDIWTESRAWLSARYIRLKGKTNFTLHGSFDSHPWSTASENTTVVIDGIDGKASFIGNGFAVTSGPTTGGWELPPGVVIADTVVDYDNPLINSTPAVEVRGNNPNTRVAMIGSYGTGLQFFQSLSPLAQVGQIFSYFVHVGFLLDDWGETDDSFLLEMFEQTRKKGPLSYLPSPQHNVELDLVRVDRTRKGFSFTPTFCGNGKIEIGEKCDDGNVITDLCPYGQTACTICSAECLNLPGQTSYCGDNHCDTKQESTSSCLRDCGVACPTENMVSWWTGNGDAKDSVGLNHGVLKGDAAFGKGLADQAFIFDGDSDMITTGPSTTNNFTAGLTFTAWVNPRDDADGKTIIGSANSNAAGYYFLIQTTSNITTLRLGGNTVHGQGLINAYNNVPANQWTHLAGTWHPTEGFKIYNNGILHTNTTTTTNNSLWGGATTAGFLIGARKENSPDNFFNGTIDEIAVWSRALSGSEIQAIYASGNKGMCKP